MNVLYKLAAGTVFGLCSWEPGLLMCWISASWGLCTLATSCHNQHIKDGGYFGPLLESAFTFNVMIELVFITSWLQWQVPALSNHFPYYAPLAVSSAIVPTLSLSSVLSRMYRTKPLPAGTDGKNGLAQQQQIQRGGRNGLIGTGVAIACYLVARVVNSDSYFASGTVDEGLVHGMCIVVFARSRTSRLFIGPSIIYRSVGYL